MTLTLQEQKKLLNLIEQYNNTDCDIIKGNIIKYIDLSDYKRNSKQLAEDVGLNIQTIYLYRQPKKKTNIDFQIALRLADALEVNIEQFITG